MDVQYAPVIIRDIRKFISIGMFDSADQLASLFLSSILHKNNNRENSDGHLSSPTQANKSTSGKDSQFITIAEIYELIADIAYERKEIKRSLNYYRLAIQQRKLLTNYSNLATSTINNGSSNYRNQFSIVMNETDAKLRFKECRCLVSLKEVASALKELETIPTKYRDLSILMLMAQLYNESNLKRHAIAAYKEALMQNPLSFEIIHLLISSFDCDFNAIMEVIDEVLKQKPEYLPILSKEKWFSLFLSSLIQKRNYDTEKSYSNLICLNTLFPKNPLIMSLIACNAMDADQVDNAIASFKKIRAMDSTIVDFMDIYSKLLFWKKDELELNRLANEMIDNCPVKPHGYIIASWFSFLKTDIETATSFLDKVRFCFHKILLFRSLLFVGSTCES
jgi:tetratricopeptide (TPR) repeat protein